jgi:hypothetical protein
LLEDRWRTLTVDGATNRSTGSNSTHDAVAVLG